MNHDPSSQPTEPRIDESLAHRYQSRLGIEELLNNVLEQPGHSLQIRSLAREAQAISPDAPAILLDLAMISHEERSNLALLVLGEMEQAGVDELIDARLARPSLPDEERIRLLTVKTFLRSDPESVMSDLSNYGDPLEMLAEITGKFWDFLSPAEMAVMWVEKFGSLTAEEKLPVLEMFMRVSKKDFPAIARIEAASGDLQIDRFLARTLADFPHPDSLVALRNLTQQDDFATRIDAEHSLESLRESHPDLAAVMPPENLFKAGPVHAAAMARDDVTGQMGLVLARESAPGEIAFCIALLDPDDLGFLDLWGNAGFQADEFDALVRSLNAPEEGQPGWIYEPIDPDQAINLLRQAEQITRQQSRPFPPGFNLWSALWQ